MSVFDAYKFAARYVQIEANSNNSERAGVAEVNRPLLLRDGVNSASAVATSDPAAVFALAGVYKNTAAAASLNDLSIWPPALDDANAKDATINNVCGGG